jgi:YidC/Oxa1 family membrane protein insertase
MSFFVDIYYTFLHQPLFNALVFLYETIPGQDVGIAIIVLTIALRFVFSPLSAKAIVAQKRLAELQPKIKAVQEQFKKDREQQTKAMLALYKEAGINPFAGILPLLIQLPLLIALYRVFWTGLQEDHLQYLYTFIPNPGVINPMFLGLIDLSVPSLVLAFIAGVAQFVQGKQLVPKKQAEGKKDFAATFQTQALYFFPVLTLLILTQLPSAVAVYWISTSAFSVWQQWSIGKKQS